eukprot:5547972-Prymnesium_polylepis.1
MLCCAVWRGPGVGPSGRVVACGGDAWRGRGAHLEGGPPVVSVEAIRPVVRVTIHSAEILLRCRGSPAASVPPMLSHVTASESDRDSA